MFELKLTNSTQKAQLDDICFAAVTQYKWYLNRSSNGGLTINRTSHPCISLGAYILGTEENEFPDHKDRNPFNNLIDNLRISSNSQNSANRNLQSNNKSGYRGVNFNQNSQNWKAYIRVRNNTYYLGTFKTKEKAALAYNKAAKFYFDEFANLNVIRKEI